MKHLAKHQTVRGKKKKESKGIMPTAEKRDASFGTILGGANKEGEERAHIMLD